MIVATAGHVDHGKTALVKALTGTDTDTLEEEKRRGLTISPGFAYTNIGRARIGFIDVPGHQQFIHNMLSSIGGIDAVLFVIAADEGVMAQTVEHMRILDLLKPGPGLLAITKTDRIDEPGLEKLEREIDSFTTNTFLASAPIVRTSAQTGSGLDELRTQLERTAGLIQTRSAGGIFRMSVDRVFHLKGVGIIATGTVHSGHITVDERLTIAPAGLTARIRGIYSDDETAASAIAGHRCAINLSGIQLSDIQRGDWLTTGEATTGSTRIDVRLECPDDAVRGLRHWTPVHVFHGTTRTTGRLALLESRTIGPGEHGLAQLVLDAPIVAIHGDRCILRNQAADETLAGAFVLDIFAPKRGRTRPQRLDLLRRMQTRDPHEALEEIFTCASDSGSEEVALESFRLNRNLTSNEAAIVFADSGVEVFKSKNGLRGTSTKNFLLLRDQIVLHVGRWNKVQPDVEGIRLDELYESGDPMVSRSLFEAALKSAQDNHDIEQSGPYYHVPGFTARLPEADAARWTAISAAMADSGPRPPTVQALAETLGLETDTVATTLNHACRKNLVIRIAPDRFFLRQSLDDLKTLFTTLASDTVDGRVTTAAYRDASGLGRNLAIEVLEYLDAIRFTRRTGNARCALDSDMNSRSG